TEKRFVQLILGYGAFRAGPLEPCQLVNHRGQFGLVARLGWADDLGHGCTPRADRIVLNFVVVSATSSSGSDSTTMPPPECASAVRRSAHTAARRIKPPQRPPRRGSPQPIAPA